MLRVTRFSLFGTGCQDGEHLYRRLDVLGARCVCGASELDADAIRAFAANSPLACVLIAAGGTVFLSHN
jgi:hypothetical protein